MRGGIDKVREYGRREGALTRRVVALRRMPITVEGGANPEAALSAAYTSDSTDWRGNGRITWMNTKNGQKGDSD